MKETECKEKAKRIQEEEHYFHFEYMELTATLVLKKLTDRANATIFSPLAGELSISLPLKESPNAGAVINLDRPLFPQIVIHMGMVREIFRDSFMFPRVSQSIASETDTIKILNEHYRNAPFTYPGGIPNLKNEHLCDLYKIILPILKEKKDPGLTYNDYAVRFMMFELMLSWVFFHELSHLTQCHYKLKGNSEKDNKLELFELENDADSDIKSQAREILADLEAFSMAISYLRSEGIFCSASSYILLCAQGCMFNRFYRGYNDNFSDSNGSHPHPVVREDFIHSLFMKLLFSQLSQNIENQNELKYIGAGLTYVSTRASLLSGLYWANRYLTFSGKLTSFMELASEGFEGSKKQYMPKLSSAISVQMPLIIGNHLVTDNTIAYLEKIHFFENIFSD